MSFQTKDHNNSIFGIFLNNTRFTYILMATVVIFGIFSLFSLDIESNPEINQPIGIVQTFYPNSSAADVESSVTKIIEQEISSLNSLKEISSNSSNNLSSITVTFESSADPKEALDSLREAVNNAAPKIANEAEQPRVFELDFNSQSIVSLSITGNKSSLELTKLAEDIAEKINKIPGVSKTELSGDSEQLIQIELDPIKLEAYNLSVGQIIGLLNNTNINAPLGSIKKSTNEVNLRLIGKIEQLDQLKNLAIYGNSLNNFETSFITLADVAYIELAPETRKTLSQVGDGKNKSLNSVTINVFKSKGGNIINIVNTIDAEIEKLSTSLPTGVNIIKTNDNAFFIKTDIANLGSNGYQTIIIIFFALLIFLTYREAFVAAIAVPVIFLMTFAIIYFLGLTLNGLTIFSLILSLGLIVDTSIVIVEGIHEYKNEGYDSIEAAKKSLATYSLPLVSGTLTTLAAFAPMLLVSGIVGEYIKTIPIVLCIVLFCSLFVSFIFTPLLSAKILKKEKSTTKNNKELFIEKLKLNYENSLNKLLKSSYLKKQLTFVLAVLFVLSMALPVTGVLKAQLFPVTDVPFLYINIETPTGTSIEQTSQLADPLKKYLDESSYIKNYVFNVGTLIDTSGIAGGTTVKSNYGHFIVNLIDDTNDRPKSFEIASEIRKEFALLNNLQVTIVEISAGPPSAAPLDIQIIGNDLETLKNISFELKNELEKIEGLVNIKTDFDNLESELSINLDQEKLRYYGVSNQEIALIIQAYTNGIDSGKVEFSDDEYEVKVYLDNSEIKDSSDLEFLPISTSKGNIPLAYLGTIQDKDSIQFILRTDQERSARVQAYTDEGLLFAEIKPITDKIINEFKLPDGYRFDLGGEDEDIQESFRDLFSSMFIAVILILIILVIQFNSFRQTLLILITIPLAVIGIFPGLALLGLPLSFPAFLGVVMLAGIVVNDAIVLIDQINYNKSQNIPLFESVINGATSRLVPIILTTVTTTFGLLPLAISDEFWRGLGFSVIFGLTTASFLTLFVIPMIYLRLYKKSETMVQVDDLNVATINKDIVIKDDEKELTTDNNEPSLSSLIENYTALNKPDINPVDKYKID